MFSIYVFFIIFTFGLIIGSFLNVYILRLNTGKDTKGRSACASCGTKLKAFDLIPFLSFFLLKGRCRKCKSKISRQYPIVEFLNAVAYLAVFYFIENKMLALALLPLASISIIIAVYDIKHQIIPQKLINFLFTNSILIFILERYLNADWQNLHTYWSALISELLFAGIIFALWYFSKGRAMGYGDVKLSAVIAFLLKPAFAWLAFTLSFVFGAIFALFYILLSRICIKAFRKVDMKSAIAFGPFILLAFWLVLLGHISVYDIMYLL